MITKFRKLFTLLCAVAASLTIVFFIIHNGKIAYDNTNPVEKIVEHFYTYEKLEDICKLIDEQTITTLSDLKSYVKIECVRNPGLNGMYKPYIVLLSNTDYRLFVFFDIEDYEICGKVFVDVFWTKECAEIYLYSKYYGLCTHEELQSLHKYNSGTFASSRHGMVSVTVQEGIYILRYYNGDFPEDTDFFEMKYFTNEELFEKSDAVLAEISGGYEIWPLLPLDKIW